jgi:hypothetical protein
MPRNYQDPLIRSTVVLPRSVWEQIERIQLAAEMPCRTDALWLVVHLGLDAIERKLAQRLRQSAPTRPVLH